MGSDSSRMKTWERSPAPTTGDKSPPGPSAHPYGAQAGACGRPLRGLDLPTVSLTLDEQGLERQDQQPKHTALRISHQHGREAMSTTLRPGANRNTRGRLNDPGPGGYLI